MTWWTRWCRSSRYDYQHVGKLVFVDSLPAAELTYRETLDGTGTTPWQGLTMRAQFDAFRVYVEHMQATAGWHDQFLAAGFELAQRGMSRQHRTPPIPLPDWIHFGIVRMSQRIATGIGKIALSRARTPGELDYRRAVPAHERAAIAGLRTDAMFGHLRVAGMNPLLLETLTDVGELPTIADPARVQAQLQAMGETLSAAVGDRRLYVVRPSAFALLSNGVPGADLEHPHRRRFFHAPTAVFVRPAGSTHPLPVAIRFDPALHTVTPGDPPLAWQRAKLHYQVADSLFHTFVVHLPQTHFVMEPIAIATRRAFADRPGHRIHRLLEPHIEGTMAVNHIARNTLFDGSSPFAEFTATDVGSTATLLGAAFDRRAVDFRTAREAYPLVDDPGLVFPFRDDFDLVAPILRDWVRDFIRLSYRTNADVAGDTHLQRWWQELRNPLQGRLLDFPEVTTLAALERAATTIVLLASLQHAALHFPQTDLGRVAFVAPFYAADVAPGHNPAKEQGLDPLRSLPDLHAASWQSFVLGQSLVRWRPLTDLDLRFADDPRERALADQLVQRLAVAEDEICRRNLELERDGLRAYAYLRPSLVPCSINT